MGSVVMVVNVCSEVIFLPLQKENMPPGRVAKRRRPVSAVAFTQRPPPQQPSGMMPKFPQNFAPPYSNRTVHWDVNSNVGGR